jgi:hypothetical protein
LARDGDIGKVHDFLFDDAGWIIRYVVVDTGKWLPGRKVLLIPLVLDEPDWENRTLPVSLTKEQIKKSPDIDVDKPVYRQHEHALHEYYQWVPYWIASPHTIPPPPYPKGKEEDKDEDPTVQEKEDPHLRSTKEVSGYHIQATDGEMGHVEDFIADDTDWFIRYMVVDMRNWLPGKKVLISSGWIERVEWSESKVYVDLSRDMVKNSPEFDPSSPVNRRYEERLYDFYGRPKYWD